MQSNESTWEQSDEAPFVFKGVLADSVSLSIEAGQVGLLHVSITMLEEFGDN